MKNLLIIALSLSIATHLVVAQDPGFQFTHKGSILHIKFSPGGSKLLSYSSGDQDMCMWDVRSRKMLWKRPISFIQLADEYYTLNVIAWSPDEKLIATGSGNGTIQLWDAATGEFIWRTQIAKSDITAVAFSPDQKTVAVTSSSDRTNAVKLVDVVDGKIVQTLKGNPCTGVAIYFDAPSRVKVGNLDGNIASWDLKSGDQIANYASPCREMRTYDWNTSFSDDLSLSVKMSSDKEVLIRDDIEGKTLRTAKSSDSKVATAVTSRGQKAIISESSSFRLYELKTGKDRLLNGCSGNTFDLSNDGSLVAVECSAFRTSIKVFDLNAGTEWFLDGHPSQIHAIVFSPDYSMLAVAGNDGNAYLFNAATRTLAASLIGGERMTAVAFSPDGKTLISGDGAGNIKIWDLPSKRLVREAKVSDRADDVEHIGFNKRGDRFVTFTNGVLLVWDPANLSTNYEIKTSEGFKSRSGNMTIGYSSVPIKSAVFSTDGTRIITGHEDGSIRSWDVFTTKQLSSIKVGDSILFLNALPEQNAIAAVVAHEGNKVIEKLDLGSGTVLKRSNNIDITYPEKSSVSPDGRYVTVTGNIGETVICDLADMSLSELEYEYSGEDSVAFSKDSKSFFIGGDNQNLTLFDTATLKKVWQLIASFQPSAAELQLAEERKGRTQKIAEVKTERERQATIDVEQYSKLVRVSFGHFGDMTDPGNKRMVETSKLNESKLAKPKSKANAAWFKLRNDSPLPIDIPTESMYLPDPKCFFLFPNKEKIFGSCGEREVGIWFGVKDKDGKWVPYGFDFGSSVTLLPGASVLFPVPLSLLDKNYRIVFNYSFQNVRASENDREWDYGPKVEVSINKNLLSK